MPYQSASAPEIKKIQNTMEKRLQGDTDPQLAKQPQGDKMNTLITLMMCQPDMQINTYDKLAYTRDRSKSQKPTPTRTRQQIKIPKQPQIWTTLRTRTTPKTGTTLKQGIIRTQTQTTTVTGRKQCPI